MRIKIIAVLAAALVLAAGGRWALGPGPRRPQPALIKIGPGSSRWQIARQLAAAGLVRSSVVFAGWSLLHPGQTLKAGTYQFRGHEAVPEVFEQLARGEVYSVQFTVPEGYNRFDIARELGRLHLASPSAFLRATADPSAIRGLDPEAVSLEGYLFPASYRIEPGEPVSRIVAQMLARFRQELNRLAVPAGGLHRWVTMASMVERETPDAAERPVIAGVFDNRLKRGLPLQCDPTVIYAELLAHRYTGALHHADLAFASPFNTYIHIGLPPGPIANPGEASLAAAAQPAQTPYLYFVSNGHGAHRFARTLAQQDRNVRLYRRALAGRAAASDPAAAGAGR